jgi:hypothetical protein
VSRLIVPISLLLWVGLLSPAPAVGQVDVLFPLGANYRVGRYVPVRVTLQGELTRVDAPGVVPTWVHASGSGAAQPTVSLLIVNPIEGRRTPAMIPQVMRPLADDERLVGATTPDAALAAELFPGRKVVDVMLDLSNPLPGPAMAWGVLDAVLLDATSAARVSEGQVAALLAGGTTVAVRTSARPAGNGPWRQHGAWWVARLDAPPVAGVVQPDRYAASPRVPPGWPATVRYTLLLALAALSLAAVAVTLLKSRKAWIASVVLSVAAAGAIALWRSRQPTVVSSVTVENLASVEDRWTTYTAVADGEFRHPIGDPDDATWPIFFSKSHARNVSLRLECGSDGLPVAFAGHLRGGQRILFLTRAFVPSPTPARAPARAAAAPPR